MLNFRIERPETVDEALGILANDPDDAVLYAGGTELILAMKEGLVAAGTLVDVKTVPELAGIRSVDDGRGLEIGARVTHLQVLDDPVVCATVPLLAQVISHVGNVRVRTAGTLVGNLCFAEPHSDIAVVGALLEATLCISGAARRWSTVEDFLLDPYVTDLAPTELVEKIRVEVPGESSFFGYARVKATERPLVAVGVRLDVDDAVTTGARVIVGAVGPRPWRSDEVEQMLTGLPVSEVHRALPMVARAIAAGVQADEDYEASEEYRRHLSGEAFLRAAVQAVSRSEGPINE
jgi:carbon-monoxide dehydrogenase medium subunit